MSTSRSRKSGNWQKRKGRKRSVSSPGEKNLAIFAFFAYFRFSSDEDEDEDDEEEGREEMKGFIADEEEEEDAQSVKSEKSRHSGEDELDDEDLDLINENLDIHTNKKKNRVQLDDSDEDEPVRVSLRNSTNQWKLVSFSESVRRRRLALGTRK